MGKSINYIQISDNDVLFLHDFLFKFHALTSVFEIGKPYKKKFTDREYLHKKCANLGKSYRSGYFVRFY